uniref:Uncharacterized protein n=1 Tax=Megaselia scalaris TaxID=36166 RepID=T1GMB2_MEGSC
MDMVDPGQDGTHIHFFMNEFRSFPLGWFILIVLFGFRLDGNRVFMGEALNDPATAKKIETCISEKLKMIATDLDIESH